MSEGMDDPDGDALDLLHALQRLGCEVRADQGRVLVTPGPTPLSPEVCARIVRLKAAVLAVLAQQAACLRVIARTDWTGCGGEL